MLHMKTHDEVFNLSSGYVIEWNNGEIKIINSCILACVYFYFFSRANRATSIRTNAILAKR